MLMSLGVVGLAVFAALGDAPTDAATPVSSVIERSDANKAVDINKRRRVTRDFTTLLIDQLVRDLRVELDTGWRPPSMQRFRDTLAYSSGVIDTRTLLSGIYSSGAIMSQASTPSGIQEAAMEIIVDIVRHRYESTIRELEDFVIPDGPDRFEDFQPRPQMGGAVGGSFTDFHSDEEREEYERNVQLLRRRTQYKGLKGNLERDIKDIERDTARLMRAIDFACDDDGRAMLRRLLTEASTPEVDYVAIAGLPGLDEPALPPWPVRE